MMRVRRDAFCCFKSFQKHDREISNTMRLNQVKFKVHSYRRRRDLKDYTGGRWKMTVQDLRRSHGRCGYPEQQGLNEQKNRLTDRQTDGRTVTFPDRQTDVIQELMSACTSMYQDTWNEQGRSRSVSISDGNPNIFIFQAFKRVQGPHSPTKHLAGEGEEKIRKERWMGKTG